MKLHARIPQVDAAEPAITRIVTDWRIPSALRQKCSLLVDGGTELRDIDSTSFRAVLVRGGGSLPSGGIALPRELEYLQAGDIVRFNQNRGELRVLFRKQSRTNVLFFTERCNSRCLMCSQPPKDVDDSYRVPEMIETIKLISSSTEMMGITGGEPTLQVDDFLRVLRCLQNYLPQTSIFCLTNGRLFSYSSYVADVASVDHNDVIFCIPLYSNVDNEHDFIVQAKGAFDQTVRGILNCGRFGIKVEIRVVIHKLNYQRLEELAQFVTRNLPFVDHVALMGLEITGFTRANLDALWIDPVDYSDQLTRAVNVLSRSGIPLSIYNHQHCVLPQTLWDYSRRSISDWKNEYKEECQRCAALAVCGGFFASSAIRSSRGISALGSEDVSATQWQ